MTDTEHSESDQPSLDEEELRKRLDRLLEELQEALCHVYSEQLEWTLSVMDTFRQNIFATLKRKDRQLQRLLAIDPEELSVSRQLVQPTGSGARKQSAGDEPTLDSENPASSQKALWQHEAAASDDRATPAS